MPKSCRYSLPVKSVSLRVLCHYVNPNMYHIFSELGKNAPPWEICSIFNRKMDFEGLAKIGKDLSQNLAREKVFAMLHGSRFDQAYTEERETVTRPGLSDVFRPGDFCFLLLK